MSDPLTFGMGQEPGAYLSMGFGAVLGKIIEKVKEVIEYLRRIIPVHRIPFKFVIPIKGDTSLPFHMLESVHGNTSFDISRHLPMVGIPSHKIEIPSKISGYPSFPIQSNIKIIGESIHKLSSQLSIQGNVFSDIKKEILCKGTKDQKELIWLILEDEEKRE